MQEPEQGTLVYRSKLDPSMTVVVVWPESDKYSVFDQIFQKAGHAFVWQEKRIVAIDGAVVDEPWFTKDHLMVIEAHELGHISAGHGPDAHGRDMKKEREADWAGYNLLVNAGEDSAASLHRQEYQARYQEFPEMHDEIMSHLSDSLK
jgi:hypothetical protein